MPQAKSTRTIAIVAALVAVIAAGVLLWRRPSLPAPGSEPYEQVTRAFYHGLAAMEVGLLDDARQRFTRATQIVPQEPAAWANLGLAQLRLGELDAAAAPVERARQLAPGNADVVLLAARMEISRGRLDEGMALLRRAIELDPDALRARFALAEELERSPQPNGPEEAARLLDEIVQRDPDNLAALVEAARVAARRQDAPRLRAMVSRIEPLAPGWPDVAVEQFRGLKAAADASRWDDAARGTVLLRNVLARVPAFGEGLAVVRTPAELIAEPFDRFVALEPSVATPSAPDAITFTTEPLGSALPAPLLADLNNDFRLDRLRADAQGIHLAFEDGAGGFGQLSSFACECVAAWPADVEMDGDLDIVAGRANGATFVLRNNGTPSTALGAGPEWTPIEVFATVQGARAFAWADIDGDADADAVFVDATGVLHILPNRQAGQFARVEATLPANIVAMTVADINADGVFDVVTLDAGGVLRRTSRGMSPRGRPSGRPDDEWETADVARWQGLNNAAPGTHRLFAADLDNNGGLDLIAAGAGESRIWLSDPAYTFTGIQNTPEGEVFSVADVNTDGRLDLLARTRGGAVRHLTSGRANYHWTTVRPRAQANAGDQRINSFGVGGDVEVRSGLLVQKQPLTGGPVHIGLGSRTSIDVARIVWPNGVPQAEFDVAADGEIVAEQRLKGSCPWVFAWNGTEIGFVTDFLWRSPLGLRINAQDTAGVTQTEDWVRIRGDQLVPRDGAYDIRITAELWETHFFDHVALLVVDHPEDTEVFVDERFSPAAPPAYAVRAVRDVRPVARAWDQQGGDVTAVVSRRDGNHLDTFARGRYQGIAEDHFVEIELPPQPPAGGAQVLLASGWIYPTDSSINVAIAQGGAARPQGLSLEAQRGDGTWMVVHPDLGFPAGKNKTIVVDLSGVPAGTRRLRLRTNLEIYWDVLQVGVETSIPTRTTKLALAAADLRYRGFSATTSPRGNAPETADYETVANRAQRWRDLEGYHTRFGDVAELLAAVDDRYVIMNAGDEMRLRFAAQPPPAAGWRRDFVLIGDGWEKDGDYNTGHSSTVLPLPAHDTPAYGAAASSGRLEDDPVYRRYPQDWERYHTRYVTPSAFLRGVRGVRLQPDR